MSIKRVEPKFVINTSCACGKYPSLPRYRASFGVIRFPAGAHWDEYKQVHGYWTCYSNENSYELGRRIGGWA